MSGLDWYKRDPRDFIHGTMGMTLEEKGAYSIVLDLIYSHGGPIPDDSRWIAGVCGCSTRRWNQIKARLLELEKITVEGGQISNQRALQEIENQELSRNYLAEKSSKSGRKVKKKRATCNENKDIGPVDKRREDTEPKGSSADAPFEDTRSILFGKCRKWIVDEYQIPDKQARSLLGKWLKFTGDDSGALVDLMREAAKARPADLVPWIEASLKPKPEKPNGQTAHNAILAGFGNAVDARRDMGGRRSDDTGRNGAGAPDQKVGRDPRQRALQAYPAGRR
jgi:uncharacterized protein YdaU (DUF1376 family)